MANNRNRETNKTRRKREIAEAVANNVKYQTSALVVYAMQDIIRQCIAAAPKGAGRSLQLYLQATGPKVTRNREGRIKAIHTEAAEDALYAIRAAYRGREKPHSFSYRVGENRETGKLLKAITDREMYHVGRDGLDFINPRHLDNSAKHWYRMNFGAGGKGAGTPPPPPAIMKFLGGSIDIGLKGYTPSAPFLLPPGIWRDRGGTVHPWDKSRLRMDSFHPTPIGSVPKHFSEGIRGSRFLDAGVTRLSKTLPQQYSLLFREWFKEYDQGSGPLTSQVVTLSASDIATARKAIQSKSRLKLRSVR